MSAQTTASCHLTQTKLMRAYLLSYCAFFLVCSCKSQNKALNIDSTTKKNLQEQVSQMIHAFVSSDYETLIKFTYPSLIEEAGGPEKSFEQIKKDIEDLKNQGVTFDSVYVGQPTIFVNAGEEIHTLIPETMFVNGPRGTLMSESYLIAITKDKGLTWYFIDAAEIDNNNIKKMLPHYNLDLKIPPKKDPILIKPN